MLADSAVAVLTVFDDVAWVVLHGDTAESPTWAVLTNNNTTFDLTGWSVFAQLRDDVDDLTAQFTWLVGDGVDVGNARVQTPVGRHVPTSTVTLYLTPSHFEQLPRRYEGVVDVEIASDSSGAPEERYTIVRFPFRVEPDVTR